MQKSLKNFVNILSIYFGQLLHELLYLQRLCVWYRLTGEINFPWEGSRRGAVETFTHPLPFYKIKFFQFFFLPIVSIRY